MKTDKIFPCCEQCIVYATCKYKPDVKCVDLGTWIDNNGGLNNKIIKKYMRNSFGIVKKPFIISGFGFSLIHLKRKRYDR